MKKELFKEVCKKVEEVTGTTEQDIMQSTNEESTDARYILVLSLYRLGLTDTEIGKFIGRTRQAVNYLRNCYKKSNKWSLNHDWQAISKWLANEFLTSK